MKRAQGMEIVTTSLRAMESELLYAIAKDYGTHMAGIARAMLRFSMECSEFKAWVDKQDRNVFGPHEEWLK